MTQGIYNGMVFLALVLVPALVFSQMHDEKTLDQPAQIITPPDGESLSCFAFAADINALWLGCSSGKIYLWDIESSKITGPPIIPKCPFAEKHINYLSVSAATNLVAMTCGEKEGMVHLWNPTTKRFLWRESGIRYPIALAFSPDGKFLCVMDSRSLQIYQTETGKMLRIWQMPQSLEGTLTFFDNDQLLVSRDSCEPARLLSIKNATSTTLEGIFAHQLAYCPKSQQIFCSGGNQYLSAFHAITREKKWHIPAESNNTIQSLQTDINGKFLVSVDDANNLISWDPKTGIVRERIGYVQSQYRLRLSPNGSWLACFRNEKGIALWRLSRR